MMRNPALARRLPREFPRELSRLRHAGRGSVMIELGAGVLILCLFAYGIVGAASMIVDAQRETRAARAGVDLVAHLDREGPGGPDGGDVERIVDAVELVAAPGPGDSFAVRMAVFEADSAGRASLSWRGAGGSFDTTPASRARISGADVSVGGDRLVLHDTEALVVVEIFRTGRGLGEAPGYTRAFSYEPAS